MGQKEKGHQKMNGLVSGMKDKREGFTLIEILIVLALIGLLAKIIVPNLQRLTPQYERKQFIGKLNEILQLGWQQSIITHKTCKIVFAVNERKVSLEIATGNYDRRGTEIFEPIKGHYLKTTFIWPEQFKFKQFFIEGFDEMARFVGRESSSIWFYLVPGGLAQDVIINILDIKDLKNNKPRMIGLVLNPFTSQFNVYDTFQKP